MGDINMDAITVEDLMYLYELAGTTCLINDGHVIQLEYNK